MASEFEDLGENRSNGRVVFDYENSHMPPL